MKFFLYFIVKRIHTSYDGEWRISIELILKFLLFLPQNQKNVCVYICKEAA